MARPLRIEFEGALYHLTGRGNARQRVFSDEKDCAKFVQLLSESLGRYEVELHAYVLMGNHYHLMATTRRANLSRWMHWLTTAYTVYFNWRHRRVGHLFQSRYKSILVEAEGYPLSLSRYLHLNPVRGKVVGRGDPGERRERLRAWKWSSYRGYSGLANPEPWISPGLILGEMRGRGRGGRRLRYRRYVEEGLLREIENPLEETRWQSILGREDFVQQWRDQLESRQEESEEIPALRSMSRKADAEWIVRCAAKAYRLPVEALLRRGGKGNEARSVAMVLVWDCCGMSLAEVGAFFGGAKYAAVAQRIARTKRKAGRGELRFSLEKLARKCEK